MGGDAKEGGIREKKRKLRNKIWAGWEKMGLKGLLRTGFLRKGKEGKKRE
jgi:hypothetical protein